MTVFDRIALSLVVVGAVNWGLVGIFKFNLVSAIFGEMSVVSRIIFALVGLAGLWCVTLIFRKMDRHE
ncbi:MAG: DUF378 domain-containing protein [Oscillospiraceae bacterium]|nr:DUF378 domain-containing protein [Oscillospiraceae bacterium]